MITQLCVCGGGVRGISFVAALYYLQQNKFFNIRQITKISSVSIGSFISACLLIGYEPDSLVDVLWNSDFKQCKDIDLGNIFKQYSLLKGDALKCFFYDILKLKGNPHISLLELYEMTHCDFYLAVTDLKRHCNTFISHQTHPNLPLIDALIMTTSIPILTPPIYDEINETFYVDGALINNLPLEPLYLDFDLIKNKDKQNKATLIITTDLSSIEKREEKEKEKEKEKETKNYHYNKKTIKKEQTFFSYLFNLLQIIYDRTYEKCTKLQHYQTFNQETYLCEIRNINGISVTSFNITKDDKLKLVLAGQEAAMNTISKSKTLTPNQQQQQHNQERSDSISISSSNESNCNDTE